MPKSRHLPEGPEELKKLDKIRTRLVRGGADQDQIAEVDEWERKAKLALILLNAKKHEGIGIILKHAMEEIRDIDILLLEQRPESLSQEHALKFAHETVMLLDRKALWRWFIDLFGVAEGDLAVIRAEVESQLADVAPDEEEEKVEDDEDPG